MTDRQTNKHPNIQTSGNDNKAHSLRDVTQQTDGIAIAYTRYSIYAVARKKAVSIRSRVKQHVERWILRPNADTLADVSARQKGYAISAFVFFSIA